MYQKIIIVGNLGRDPEMRYTPDGTPVTTFSVATNRKWTNADGSPREETVWFRVTAWRQLGETCNQYLRKGRPVLVEGRAAARPTTATRVPFRNDGSRASFEVTARNVRFLGGRGEAGPGEAPASRGATRRGRGRDSLLDRARPVPSSAHPALQQGASSVPVSRGRESGYACRGRTERLGRRSVSDGRSLPVF